LKNNLAENNLRRVLDLINSNMKEKMQIRRSRGKMTAEK
jgi:hypothetical protein